MSEVDWRADGERYFEQARHQHPEAAAVYATLAVYCELRHGNDGGTAARGLLNKIERAVADNTSVTMAASRYGR